MAILEVGSDDTAVVSGVTGELLETGLQGTQGNTCCGCTAGSQAYFVVLLLHLLV